MVAPSNHTLKPLDPAHPASGFRFLYFSELQKRPVCAGKIKDRIGKLTDLVFRLAEPYPEAIGLYKDYLSHFGTNIAILNAIGECQQKLGNAAEALVAWEKSLQIEPNQPALKDKVRALKDKK